MKSQINTGKQLDLFEKRDILQKDLPLALRMRPRTLSEFVGQRHLLGPAKLLRRAIEADRISSLILYGPPGTGKTALAYCISNITKSHFQRLNAVESNVAEIREVISQAKSRKYTSGKRTLLFIDEIHRFNRAQQDVLMPNVEEGNPILIGATVHNPCFAISSPLLSRSMVFEFYPLKPEEVLTILNNAIHDKQRGLGNFSLKIEKGALVHLAKVSDGDARRALNALEIAVMTTPPHKDGSIHFTTKVAQESIQRKLVGYDRDEDGHYDTASAFIKSMRGSDPDATLYWLAKMLFAGEDPRFIARRICICAAEDVGNADPQALVLANAALQISEFIGMPEARIPLAQASIYVACAPKSNASYLGIEQALADVKNNRTLSIPAHLKDASYPGAKRLGRGKGYKYAHNFRGHFVKQEYIPKKATYYQPTLSGYEEKIRQYLKKLNLNQKPVASKST